MEGLQPISAEQYCAENPDEIEFYEPSGFRRIPLTTCKGGIEMDKTRTAHPCPGHEEEFERRRGVSGVAIFFAVVIHIAFASVAGWWVWRKWQAAGGHFGQIRLGEQSSLDNEAPWIKYPVIAVSAVAAVVGNDVDGDRDPRELRGTGDLANGVEEGLQGHVRTRGQYLDHESAQLG